MSSQEAETLLDSIVVIAAEQGPGLSVRDLVLRRGQTLNGLLIENGASAVDGHRAASKLGERINLRRLQIGQTVTVTYTIGDDQAQMVGVALTLRSGRQAVVGRTVEGRWQHGPAAIVSGDHGAGDDEERPVVVGLAERTTARGDTETATIVLGKGELLFQRIVGAGGTRAEAGRAVRELAKLINLRRLQIGETFRLTFATPDEGGRAQLIGLSANIRGNQVVVLGWPLVESFQAAAVSAPSLTVIHVEPAAESTAEAAEGEDAEAEAVDFSGLPPADHRLHVLTVARGDNLTALLSAAGAGRGDIARALRSLRTVYNPNRLSVGRRLVVEVATADEGGRLVGLTLQTGRASTVVVERSGDGFVARKAAISDLEDAITIAEAHGRRLAALPVDKRLAFAEAAETGDDLATRVDGHRVVDLSSGALVRTITISRGDTLMAALVEAGVERREAHAAIAAMRELYDPRKLRVGQELAVTFINSAAHKIGYGDAKLGNARLGAISLDLGAESRLEAVRLEEGGFVSGFVDKDLVRDVRRVEGVIETSLYDAAIAAGMPLSVMMEMIGIYSFSVDFQRDIRQGDQFALMFEMLVDESGEAVQAGNILFASMTLSGDDMPLYRYQLADGRVDYFDAQGRSTRRALMRTPINGARLSSRYGMRRHPILGYSKMHKGLDFAAPRGTPVYAAGDGVVERASRHGAFGKYVRIRHNNDYSTAYAHLSGYAKGLFPGKRVQQGETIGFVGSTGRSTGPHLHYEIFRGGKHVNPLSVKLPTGVRLAGADLARFADERDRVAAIYAELPSISELAESDR